MTLNLSVFRDTDREECAVLVGRVHEGIWHIAGAVRVPNTAKRNADYSIRGSDLVRVMDTLKGTPYMVVGFLHTHLPHHQPEPTQADFDGIVYKASINAVFHPSSGTLTWYTSQGIIGEEAVACEYTLERGDALRR